MNLNDCSIENWLEHEKTCNDQLQNTSWTIFPSLNRTNLNHLKDGQLVRFTGMIQDMRCPKYYVESCIIINKETNERIKKSGKYLEYIPHGENEEVDEDNIVRNEFQTFYVISTPAENQWVQEIDKEKNSNAETATTGGLNKRSLEELNVRMDTEDCPANSSTTKKRRTEAESNSVQSTISTEYLLNFPIKNVNGSGCLVQVYSNAHEIKLNDVFEFVGFLSLNPALSQETDDNETLVHNPSPALIPRLQCLGFKKVQHSNPLVSNPTFDPKYFETIKNELMILLTQLLFGDEIAAEYLLYHLISQVYIRKDLMALGKFSLNLSNIPQFDELKFVEELYKFLQLFVTKSHYLPLTIENLNEMEFVPKKDYDNDRLTSGVLQLSANTHLILDETKLEPGKLDPIGVKTIQEIANVIRNQKITYDFKYYPVEFECDIPILVASEGKSMLPTDCHLPLRPNNTHLETYAEILVAAKQFLKPELLLEIRKYLTLCRLVPYTIEDNVHEIIQNKFLQMREHGGTVDDLHNLIVLSRLIGISLGGTTLNEKCLNAACKLEQARKLRVL